MLHTLVLTAGLLAVADNPDTKKDRPKRGAASTKRKPGTLRRFVDLIQQLDLTYDLYSMQPT